MRNIPCASLLGAALSRSKWSKAIEEFGPFCRGVGALESQAMDLLAAAHALRQGRKKVLPEDIRDAAIALTDLFCVDVTELQPPKSVPPPALVRSS